MLDTEKIKSWNEIFPTGQIQQSDVKNPTETFLVRILSAYLEKFGYKVEPPTDAADLSREKRLFLIRLAANIDRMLKITDKSLSLFYYDLIKPVPKKTSHTLDILLNYWFYFDMFKKETFELANERIKEYKNLKEQIQASKKDNEERKERADHIGDEIARLSIAVPKIRAQLDTNTTQKCKLEEKIHKEQEALHYFNSKINDLHAVERDLKNKIVADEHAMNIKSELDDLQEKIKEHVETEKNLNTAFDERIKCLNAFENDTMFSQLQLEKETLRTLFDEYKELQKKVKQLKFDYENLFRKNLALESLISEQENELESLKEKMKDKKQKIKNEKTEISTNIIKLRSTLVSAQQELKSVKSQLHDALKLVEEHRSTRITLEIACTNILSNYKDNGKA